MSASEVSATPSIRRSRKWNIFLIGAGVFILAVALLAPVLPLQDPGAQDLERALRPPVFSSGGSWDNILGTDPLGRDYLSRLVFGTRLTVIIALSAVFLGALFGSLLGVIAGFKGGKVDAVISRITEAQLALPFILLGISVIVARGQSTSTLILVLALVGWAQYVRIIRAETLSLKERGFISSLRIGGLSDMRIIFRHVIPNVFGTILTLGALEIGTMILAESALSFLGLGVVEPDISWGAEMASGKDYLQMSWWLVTFPGIAISLTVLYVNLAGDALRSRYDLRKRMF
jgi:peptide/nickel transport system permease protein